MRARLVLVAGLLVVGGSVLPAGHASLPPTCADPRPTTAYRIQDKAQAPTTVKRAPVLCEHRSGFHGAEPMAVVNRRGTLFLAAGASENGDGLTAIVRSRDKGRTWQRLPLPEGFKPMTSSITVDAVTDRLFFTSVGLSGGCGSPVGFSDDEGTTWRLASPRPGCLPYATLGDWPKIFTGPYTGAPVGSYPRAVYFCNTLPFVLTNPVTGCWRSDDGGSTFAFQSLLPTHPLVGACGTRIPGAVLHAAGRLDDAGVVRVPVLVCGHIGIMTSHDQAQTWTWTDVGASPFVGSVPIPDPDSPPLDTFFNGLISNVLDEDSAGNLYLTWVNRVVQLAVSTDHGKTWRVRSVSPPGLRANYPAVAANRAGEVALSYMATSATGATADGQEWKAWMSYSADADRPQPVFSSGAISKLPVYITSHGSACCHGPSNEDSVIMTEMTGVVFAPDGRAWAGFVRFDQAGDGRAELLAGELQLPPRRTR